jgi:hypothetical protein
MKMNRLQYEIRRRKHMERTETKEWLILVVCLIGVVIALSLAWARDEKTGDCYFSAGREIQIGKWRDVGDGQMACIKR